MNDIPLTAPAAERNKDHILAVLGQVLPAAGHVVEIGSGTGQHIVHFARALSKLTWQPSDPDQTMRDSIRAWVEQVRLPNLMAPLDIDVCAEPWPLDGADALISINMIHIAPFAATQALMSGAARLLAPRGRLVLYGPFRQADRPLAPTNEAFDALLRSQNLDWGLRDLEAVVACAEQQGLAPYQLFDMPANNLIVVFEARPAKASYHVPYVPPRVVNTPEAHPSVPPPVTPVPERAPAMRREPPPVPPTLPVASVVQPLPQGPAKPPDSDAAPRQPVEAPLPARQSVVATAGVQSATPRHAAPQVYYPQQLHDTDEVIITGRGSGGSAPTPPAEAPRKTLPARILAALPALGLSTGLTPIDKFRALPEPDRRAEPPFDESPAPGQSGEEKPAPIIDDALLQWLVRDPNLALRPQPEPAARYNDTPSLPPPSEQPASLQPGVSLMITRRQRVQLMELGYSQAEIRTMTPSEAHEHLRRSGL